MSVLLWLVVGLGALVILRAVARAARSSPASIALGALTRGLHIDVKLTYRDANGQRTERLVTVQEVEGPKRADGSINIHILRCYCHTEKAPRTFRMDRVLRAADADGVVINGLQDWLRQRVAGTPPTETAPPNHRDWRAGSHTAATAQGNPQRHERGPILLENANVDVDMIYRSSIGERIARRVTIHEIQGTGHRDRTLTLSHIRGYCHLRRADRTFRIDRIIQASDPGTGEVGSTPEAMIAALCRLKGAPRPVQPDTVDFPIHTGPARKIVPMEISIEDGTAQQTEHYTIKIDTVYGAGAGFEGIAHRAKTATKRGFGGRKAFSAIPDHPHHVWRASTPDGPIGDLQAWLRGLPTHR